ncbi:MAG: hypothetical protein A6F71_09100 [Cycloclasticus sp. symbiont of Poecilosclerida sp. M]|nr:MAG: hypothetical protein A6F71_09100 [Cycloclasticus sp. symbiont of Poecilosclerida sp. M]
MFYFAILQLDRTSLLLCCSELNPTKRTSDVLSLNFHQKKMNFFLFSRVIETVQAGIGDWSMDIIELVYFFQTAAYGTF